MSYRVFVSERVPKPDDDDAQEIAEQFATVCRRRGKWNTFDSDKIRGYFDLTTHVLQLVKKVGERYLVAGFLLLTCPEGGTTAEIKLVCVAESEKGQGLSKRLIDKAKDVATKAGKTELELERGDDDPKLVKVYTDQGFVEKGGHGWMSVALTGGSHTRTRRVRRKSSRRRTLSRRR